MDSPLFKCNYKMVSFLNDLPITITAVIYAESEYRADLLFRDKALETFTPNQFKEIALNSYIETEVFDEFTGTHVAGEIKQYSIIFDGSSLVTNRKLDCLCTVLLYLGASMLVVAIATIFITTLMGH